ncbi:hypothetical protein BDV95DRAFT_603142 [Massariosphaeria phaeospora]|uniref:Rhodopsin domain-containing protein n=1 Tax=Massariosphaeria phaeospora TaxID=100035 RepID=A0A7C8IBU0_9PLEO|nr:hypothetical protein BDV95DRAFT_603142 [Massariosphaeria phaeospora]
MGLVSGKAASFIVISCLLLPLSAGAVFLRVLASRTRKQALKPQDYLVFLSFFCLVGYVIGKYFAIGYGGHGRHVKELNFDEIVITLKLFFAGQWFWATSVASFRVAILLTYMEIFRQKSFRRVAITTAAVVVAYWVACVFTISLLCRPIAYNWNRKIKGGTCGNTTAIELFSGAFNMVVDIWVVFLPLPLVWRLQMTKQKKWGVTVSFALGLLTAGINLGRLIDTVTCPARPDFSYCGLDSSILITAEMSGGILVACVPTFGVIFFANRGNRSGKSYPKDGTGTIGSKPIKMKRSPGATLDSNLFSKTESRWAEDEVAEELTKDPADMGTHHRDSMGRSTGGDSDQLAEQHARTLTV